MTYPYLEALEDQAIADAPQYVFRFDEVESAESQTESWDEVRGLLGGKGANLGDMTRLGIPVPPGFTISTVACNTYLANDEVFPVGLEEQISAAVMAVEEMTGKRFGDPENPLLFSCRSGAKFSMPGMMDTVLNIGLNDEVVAAWIERTQDARFVYDAYRRLVQMFGSVVLDVPDELFEVVIAEARRKAGVETDAELSAETWHAITNRFKNIIYSYAGEVFPNDPHDQLFAAIEAIFTSWNGKRAIDYRNASHIPHDLGTAVNIQTMVFGNWGEGSATGVAMSRNATTGEKQLEGDFLVNAQGEDVVAGIRLTQPISELRDIMPEIYDEFTEIAQKLEQHYRNMQDMEFTVEHGKLWILQTRDGKRTAQAAVRIAVEMVDEGLIDQKMAVLRVQPEQIDFFMHPRFSAETLTRNRPIAHGLNVSPGAAVGKIALDANTAEAWAKAGETVIMARPETKPDDVHGMLAAVGILTSRGGRTSHAALVARQFGKPAVVGVEQLQIDFELRNIVIDDLVLAEGEMISLDGSSGLVYQGALPTETPDISNPYLLKLLDWADDVRTLHVWANAESEYSNTLSEELRS